MGEVHRLLEERGRQEVRQQAEGRRGPRIVEAAAGWASDEDIGTGYMYSGWCQTALPHKRLADDAAIWKLETDSMTLLVEPGVRVLHGGDPVHVGVPFGAIARLILIYLQSEALKTGCRDVELGRLPQGVSRQARHFDRRKDGEASSRTSRAYQPVQTDFHGQRGKASVLVNQNIVDVAMFLVPDEAEGQGNLFVEKARLSETFFNQLRQHAVPLDEAAIRHIRNSSMALDVYCWLAYRLHSLSTERPITWAALAGQFGGGIKLRKHFKAAFTESLALAMAVYRDANVEVTATGLILRPSPPPVRKLLTK